MPPALILDNGSHREPLHQSPVCRRTTVPPDSVMGSARAESPLLEKPLEGTVYLATGYGHKLPDVLAALKGQVDVNLDGGRQQQERRVCGPASKRSPTSR